MRTPYPAHLVVRPSVSHNWGGGGGIDALLRHPYVSLGSGPGPSGLYVGNDADGTDWDAYNGVGNTLSFQDSGAVFNQPTPFPADQSVLFDELSSSHYEDSDTVLGTVNQLDLWLEFVASMGTSADKLVFGCEYTWSVWQISATSWGLYWQDHLSNVVWNYSIPHLAKAFNHYILAIDHGGNSYAYVNGVLVNTRDISSVTGNLNPSLYEFTIGARNAAGQACGSAVALVSITKQASLYSGSPSTEIAAAASERWGLYSNTVARQTWRGADFALSRNSSGFLEVSVSGATYMRPTGKNFPRIAQVGASNFDPHYRGLISEPACTNDERNSMYSYIHGYGAEPASYVNNSVMDPNGEMADTVVEGSSAAEGTRIYRLGTWTNGPMVWSERVKRIAGQNWFGMFSDYNDCGAAFDLVNKTVGTYTKESSGNFDLIDRGVIDRGDGWLDCWMSFTWGVGTGLRTPYCRPLTGDAAPTYYQGIGVAVLYSGQHQFCPGQRYPHSDIITVGSALSTVADTVSVDVLGLLGDSGTIRGSFWFPPVGRNDSHDQDYHILGVKNAAATNLINLFLNPYQDRAQVSVYTGLALQVNSYIFESGGTEGGACRYQLSWKPNLLRLQIWPYGGSITQVEDTSCTFGTDYSTMYIGNNTAGAYHFSIGRIGDVWGSRQFTPDIRMPISGGSHAIYKVLS